MALIFVILALAGPRFGFRLEEVKREGVEIIFALDVSTSMLAEDISPSRLERSKMAISRLIGNMVNDKVGLIVFAGDAFVQVPLTSDYTAARMILDNISTDLVPVQGTAIGRAIDGRPFILPGNFFKPKSLLLFQMVKIMKMIL
jgi:Ca-activated chloride channel homolog